MLLTLVFSEKNALHIGSQWEECSLHWWSVGGILLQWWSVGGIILNLVVNQKNAPCSGRLWKKMLLTLVVIRKNASYIGSQWEECSPYNWVQNTTIENSLKKKNWCLGAGSAKWHWPQLKEPLASSGGTPGLHGNLVDYGWFRDTWREVPFIGFHCQRLLHHKAM